MIRIVLLLTLIPLAGCGVAFGGPPLISGQSPQAANSAQSEPQPVNSLPPGFAGIGPGPNATSPNEASLTFPTPF